MSGMHIRIDAVDLPGLTCPAPADAKVPAYGNIHVAVQRRDCPAELLDPQPADAASATWTLECTAISSPTGTEVKGPYVQDRLGHRFIYLSWGTVDESGTFTMFRRAKLMLDAVPAGCTRCRRTRRPAGRTPRADRRVRQPLCARVVPPHISWTAEPAA